MYRVISPFWDLKNDEHLYKEGDIYPVEGYKPTKTRIKELAEGKNPFNRVFIVEETSEEDIPDDSAEVDSEEDIPDDSAEVDSEEETFEETSEANE